MPLTEAQRAYQREYYQKNRGKRLAKAKRWYHENRSAKHIYDKERREAKGKELRAYDARRYYAGRKYALATQFTSAKQRAKRKGIVFTITLSDLPPIPSVCPIMGTPLVRHFGRGGREDSVSLDRINNDLGYIPGNVAFISSAANRLKSGMTVEQIRNLLHYVEANGYSAGSS